MKKFILTFLLAACFLSNVSYAQTNQTSNNTNTAKSSTTTTTTSTTSNKEKKYSAEDLHWLSRIVQAEAGGESYEGKLAVANVILNRVKSKKYPNTVKGVIFDKKYAVQFSPTVNGTIYRKPSAQSIKAATEALNGKNNIGNALSFSNFSAHKSKKKQVAYKKIGNHTFY